MRLKIDNFAKIKHADIAIDGITVLAGENNTGKSTIGKVLYSSFNSLYDIDLKIEKRRYENIYNVCSRCVRNTVMHGAGSSWADSSSPRAFSEKITRDLVKVLTELKNNMINESMYINILLQIFSKYNADLSEEGITDLIDNSYEKILSLKKDDNHEIAMELIQRFFLQVFDSQIQCLLEEEKTADVTLVIKDKEMSLKFRDNKCVEWKTEFNVLHEAFLIDDPFVLDNLREYYFFTSTSGIRGQLIDHLRKNENDLMDGIFEAVQAKENLKEIYEILDKVTAGKISVQNGQWGLNSPQYGKTVHFENLSAGLKSFVLIKMLLEKGILKEKDVLILDEPEIHLHPEWQLIYAEIIVLLQKMFDLSIVVTTHSRDFLEAIELNLKKHKLTSKCNFYLSDVEDGLVTFENVTDNLGKIYGQLVSPSMLLDKLRYEIGIGEDD